MGIGDIIWSAFVTLTFLFTVTYGANWLGPFLRDYRFSGDGIDVVRFGGRMRKSWIKREDIKEVLVTSGLAARLRYPFTYDLTNRWKRRVVFVLTTRGKSYMLTPADPYAAMSALGFDPDLQNDLPKMTRTRKLVIAAIGVGVFAVFCAAVVQFIYLAFALPTNNRDNADPAKQQEMLKIALEVGRLAPIPESATIASVKTEGNVFARSFRIEFRADSSTIKSWCVRSKGIQECRLEKIGGNEKYILRPQKGYQWAEVVVDHSANIVYIYVWSS